MLRANCRQRPESRCRRQLRQGLVHIPWRRQRVEPVRADNSQPQPATRHTHPGQAGHRQRQRFRARHCCPGDLPRILGTQCATACYPARDPNPVPEQVFPIGQITVVDQQGLNYHACIGKCRARPADTALPGSRLVPDRDTIIIQSGRPRTLVSDRQGSENDPGERFAEAGPRVNLDGDPVLLPGCRHRLARQCASCRRHAFSVRPADERQGTSQASPAGSGTRFSTRCCSRRWPKHVTRSATARRTTTSTDPIRPSGISHRPNLP